MDARRGRHRIRAVAAVLGAVLAAGSVLGTSPAAQADSYPSWADVVAARANAAATQREVTAIQTLIAQLNAQVQSTQADADAKGAAAEAAENLALTAEGKEQTLESALATATAQADAARKSLGEYLSQLARVTGGGQATTLHLLLHGDSATDILNGLSDLGEVSQAEKGMLQRAIIDENEVHQLSDQAKVAADELKKRQKAADDALAVAAAAAAAAQSALDAQTTHEQALQVQLTALTSAATMTYTQYQAGVAAAAAAAAAARAAAGGGVGAAGVVDSQGWALPTEGRITSPWGYRYDPAAGYAWRMHYGDDIADGCLMPIYAAHSGTVTYAGPYGDIGNFILIQDGDQYWTSYGHIANGQTFVQIGQHVAAGQNIARTGSTGTSTGCHLYFQVYVAGDPVDPVPFMAARGIHLG